MAINNSLSKTFFKFEKDRIQHYTHRKFKCLECDLQYNPKVHSQPYIVQFGAIIIGVLIYFLMKYYLRPVYLLPFLIPIFIWYYQKTRKVKRAGQTEKIKYGQVVLECPNCKSTDAIEVNIDAT